jgi:mono/diheme cytochrome c family protein
MKKLICLLALSLSAPALADDAATLKLYKAQCATCHGLDGKGGTTAGKKVGVKDWTDPKVLKPLSDADIEKQLKEGLTKDGKELMPSFAKLGDDKLKALIVYVRQFQPK